LYIFEHIVYETIMYEWDGWKSHKTEWLSLTKYVIYLSKIIEKPSFYEDLHGVQYWWSLSQGYECTYGIGCIGVAKSQSGEDHCVVNLIHEGLFQHLNEQDKFQHGGIKTIFPYKCQFIAYKYCTTSIHGKQGLQKWCPLLCCIKIYIKTWFAEHEYPYNLAGFTEASTESLI
jgi:hypothetical protein